MALSTPGWAPEQVWIFGLVSSRLCSAQELGQTVPGPTCTPSSPATAVVASMCPEHLPSCQRGLPLRLPVTLGSWPSTTGHLGKTKELMPLGTALSPRGPGVIGWIPGYPVSQEGNPQGFTADALEDADQRQRSQDVERTSFFHSVQLLTQSDGKELEEVHSC